MQNRRLSRTINLEDFTLSETAHRHGIDNWPADEVVIANLQQLAEHILEPVGRQFDTRPMVSSGYRCPILNEKVGGVANSQHTTGQAVDFQVPGVPELVVAQWMAEHLAFDQLLLEQLTRRDRNIAWLHCSYVSPAANRREVKHGGGSDFTPGLPEQWP